jgi:hypothetical protein
MFGFNEKCNRLTSWRVGCPLENIASAIAVSKLIGETHKTKGKEKLQDFLPEGKVKLSLCSTN